MSTYPHRNVLKDDPSDYKLSFSGINHVHGLYVLKSSQPYLVLPQTCEQAYYTSGTSPASMKNSYSAIAERKSRVVKITHPPFERNIPSVREWRCPICWGVFERHITITALSSSPSCSLPQSLRIFATGRRIRENMARSLMKLRTTTRKS